MYAEWVEKFRGKNKEIKKVQDKFYLYERKTVWDKEKKRAKKISGKYLGRITEDGLVAPKKRLSEEIIGEQIPNKEYGASDYLCSIGGDIIDHLRSSMKPTKKELPLSSPLMC